MEEHLKFLGYELETTTDEHYGELYHIKTPSRVVVLCFHRGLHGGSAIIMRKRSGKYVSDYCITGATIIEALYLITQEN